MKKVGIRLFLLVGCANDPEYLPSPQNMEAGMDNGSGGTTGMAIDDVHTQICVPQ